MNLGRAPFFEVGDGRLYDAHGALTVPALDRGVPFNGPEWTALRLNPDAFYINKVGRNTDIDTGTDPEDIWDGGGLYPGFPTGGAVTVSAVSTNAGDMGDLSVFGLDADWNATTRTVMLNGLTPVVVPGGPMRRVHSAAYDSGTDDTFNLGAVTISGPANVFQIMEAGRSQTNAAVYTIPAGHTALLLTLFASIRTQTASDVDGDLWVREFGKSPRLRRPFAATTNASFQSVVAGGLVLPEKTDIAVRASRVFANSTEVVAGFDLLLTRNP